MKINLSAIYSYLSFRYPTNNKEYFFNNIKKIKPEYFLEIDLKSKITKQIPYWQISFDKNEKKKSEKFYLEKLDYLLNESVKRHLQSDVPVGVFLEV